MYDGAARRGLLLAVAYPFATAAAFRTAAITTARRR
jgi:hypothetical protein